MNEGSKGTCEERRTLVNAVEKLHQTFALSEQIEKLSDEMLGKFERSIKLNEQPLPTECEGREKKQIDLLGMFYDIDNRIQKSLKIIGKNIEEVNLKID